MADAKAAESTVSDATTPTATPPAKPSAELTDEDLDKVSGGFIGDVANMKHESLKGIAQNLRG